MRYINIENALAPFIFNVARALSGERPRSAARLKASRYIRPTAYCH
jgi:hypothetical protein